MIAAALLILVALPGVALGLLLVRRRLPEIAWFSIAGAYGILWSIGSTFLLTLAQIRLSDLTLTVVSSLPLLAALLIPQLRTIAWTNARAITWDIRRIVLWILTVAFLAVPFLTIHRGLPTGDVQKSLFWAQEILVDNRIPNYADATKLNRDPTDFFTPGLHTITAAIGALSDASERGSAWFSFVASVILAGLAAALASIVTHDPRAPAFAFLIGALNLRFLRYAFSPGYHYQNLLGEIVLLLALIALLLALERTDSKGTRYALVTTSVVALAVLPLIHQFTAFLALFLAPAMLLAILLLRRASLRSWWRELSPLSRKRWIGGTALAVIVAGVVLSRTPLAEKLPDLFTTTPHLTPFLISPLEYPALLGPSLVLFGIMGILVSLRRVVYPSIRESVLLLTVWTLTVLVLGQGPRFFVDVPSARVLFYAALPFAVFASILLTSSLRVLERTWPRAAPAASLVLVTLVLAPFGQTAARELRAVTHETRVNATLTDEALGLLTFLRQHPPSCADATMPHGRCPMADAPGGDAILIDDWNRRRLTWTILSPYRMLTRVGGDLRVIAEESAQSPLRKSLYDAHLDFEKIFMGGNSAFIAPLLETHGIALVGTANGVTDDVFRSSPMFREVFRTAEVTIFARQEPPTRTEDDPLDQFLLAPTTLVNDVGDHEDVLPHTALSLASTRLTDPAIHGGRTVRTIESDLANLRVNVDTYVRPLWDADRDERIDPPLRLLLRTHANGARVRVTAGAVSLGTISLPRREDMVDTTIDIPQHTLTMDEQGFVALTLSVNDGPLILDLVALGIPQESR